MDFPGKAALARERRKFLFTLLSTLAVAASRSLRRAPLTLFVRTACTDTLALIHITH